jgi:hypothetical protein
LIFQELLCPALPAAFKKLTVLVALIFKNVFNKARLCQRLLPTARVASTSPLANEAQKFFLI